MSNNDFPDNDHLDAEYLSGNAIPINDEEKQAAMDFAVEELITGNNPIENQQEWTKNLPNAEDYK